MIRRLTAVVAFGLFLFGTGPGQAVRAADEPKKPTAEEIKDAQKLVVEELIKLKGQNGNTIEPITEDALFRAFPGYLFFSVVYRQYPVGIAVPEPLKPANLFIVPREKDAKPQLVNDPKKLETFFRDKLGRAGDDNKAKDAVRAWLYVSPVLMQDGFYKFELMDDSTKVASGEGKGKVATGKVVVMKGGNGEINVTLAFDDAGNLNKVTQEAKVKPGPRPICQATKLLDADPIVRRMAEQDLLIMGDAAKEYLAEQRAKASPELKQAIDRIWQRILEEGR
jgi:hypothetical protein